MTQLNNLTSSMSRLERIAQPVFTCEQNDDGTSFSCTRKLGVDAYENTVEIESKEGTVRIQDEDLFTLSNVQFGHEVTKEEKGSPFYTKTLEFAMNCISSVKKLCFAEEQYGIAKREPCASVETPAEQYARMLKNGMTRNTATEANLLAGEMLYIAKSTGRLEDGAYVDGSGTIRGRRLTVDTPSTLRLYKIFNDDSRVIQFLSEIDALSVYTGAKLFDSIGLKVSKKTIKKAKKIVRKGLSINKYFIETSLREARHQTYFEVGGVIGTADMISKLNPKLDHFTVVKTLSERSNKEEDIKKRRVYKNQSNPIGSVGVAIQSLTAHSVDSIQQGIKSIMSTFNRQCKPITTETAKKDSEVK